MACHKRNGRIVGSLPVTFAVAEKPSSWMLVKSMPWKRTESSGVQHLCHGMAGSMGGKQALVVACICHGGETIKLDVGKKHAMEKDKELRCAVFVSWYGREYGW